MRAWLIPVVKANAILGLRAGEVVNLRWDDVDLSKKQVLVSNTNTFNTKNKRDRVIPLCEAANDILSELNSSTEFVFPSYNERQLHRKYLSRRFKHFVLKAGLDDRYNFHCLRHTAITRLISNGASLEAGHSSVRVTEIYSHLPEMHYRRQIESAFAAKT